MTKRFILVSGVMASGKTRLAQELAERLNLPLIAKDGIKEILFDTLGYSDREWSKKLGGATFALLFHDIGELMRGAQPFIVEGNFRAPAREDFLKVTQGAAFEVLQVLCGGDGEEMLRRFEQRVASGERHPGHADSTTVDEFRAELLKGWFDPLDLPGAVIKVDTTDFKQVDYGEITARVRQWLGVDNG